MSQKKSFLIAGQKHLHLIEEIRENIWQQTQVLSGFQINCLVVSPIHTDTIYLGTQKNGVLMSENGGKTWVNLGLKETIVKSIALAPNDPQSIFAGCKPVSLYHSSNGGKNWQELESLRRSRKWWWFSPAEPPDWSPYVIALTISPTQPNLMLAGIELGGVLRSEDGGLSWSRHRRGALRDCHSLMFHPTNGDWAYQGGAGLRSGLAFSQDGGISWRQPKMAVKKNYGWMVAADPVQPEVFYLASSPQPKVLKGEFIPPAHSEGNSNASIFRSTGGMKLESISPELPSPLHAMPYALVTTGEGGHLYAGLRNGEVWHTSNFGEHWTQMAFQIDDGIQTMVLL